MAGRDICAEVENLLAEYLAENALELHKIEYKKEGSDWVLRVYPDKPEQLLSEYVSIEECEALNRYLSDKLDEVDIIDRAYNLEVCSPGLDRELIKDIDYVRFAGRQVEVRTYEQVDGSKYFEGTLVGRDEDFVTISIGSEDKKIPNDIISKINLAVVF